MTVRLVYFFLIPASPGVTFVSQNRITDYTKMSKNNDVTHKGRMIHIRLDEDTHLRLKVHAAESRSTIQQLVEALIRRKYSSSRTRKEKA